VRSRLFLVSALFAAGVLSAQTYDIVIANGRVIDPESNLDAVRWVGINGRTIRAVSPNALKGRTIVDAKGLVVASGFIDLHEHGQDPEAYRFQAQDGVTSTFELEVGTADVAGWYAAREKKSARAAQSFHPRFPAPRAPPARRARTNRATKINHPSPKNR